MKILLVAAGEIVETGANVGEINDKNCFDWESDCDGWDVVFWQQLFDLFGIFEKPDELDELDELDEFEKCELLAVEHYFKRDQSQEVRYEPGFHVHDDYLKSSLFYSSIRPKISWEEPCNHIDQEQEIKYPAKDS